MYVSGGIDEKALNVSNNVAHIIEQLRSNHEEADTCMLLHVAYLARQSAKRVIVANPDTDGFFYLYIILVTWMYVQYSLKLEGKVPMQI